MYLAGPEVFLPSPDAVAAAKKSLCRAYGFEGVFPLDADIDLTGLAPREMALRISLGNENLIRSCSLLVANMTPFRGPSADVGTAYEMGFARGIGRLVLAYTNVDDRFAERTAAMVRGGARRRGDVAVDERDMTIEPFGLRDNLMLEGGVVAGGAEVFAVDAGPDEMFTDLRGFEACLRRARELTGAGPR